MCSGIALIGRIVIGILSLVFAIAGLGIAIAGILVKVNHPMINSLMDFVLAAIKQQASSVSPGAQLNTDNLDINALVGSLAIVFIIVGCVFLFIGILGLVGACCSVRIILQLYMLIIVVILIAQVVLVVVIAGDRKIVTEPPKKELLTAFKADYAGVRGADTISLLWNVIMTGLQCCGIDGVQDILTSPNWLDDERAIGWIESPVACCKTGEFNAPGDPCVMSPDNTNSNVNNPCYDQIFDFAFQGTWFIIVALSSLGFHTLLAIFAYAILSETGNKNKVGAA